MYIINATFPKLLSRCVMALETHKAPNIYVNKSILHFLETLNLSQLALYINTKIQFFLVNGYQFYKN